MDGSNVRHSRPRSKAWLAGAVVAGLAIAGAAIAAGPSATNPVSATFTATTVVTKNVQTCIGADGTYELTHATYSGTSSSSDPSLNGPIRIDVKSVYNTTKNLGWLNAKLRVNGSTGDNAHGNLSAVNAGGKLQGFLNGTATAPGRHLLANVSASFASATGFGSGQLGTGSATNTAVVSSGSCKPPKPHKPNPPTKPTHPKPPKHHHH
jgi:hypothetical protein